MIIYLAHKVDARARVAAMVATRVFAPQVTAVPFSSFPQLSVFMQTSGVATPAVVIVPHLRPSVHPVPSASPVELHASPCPTFDAEITRPLLLTGAGASEATTAAQVPAGSVKQHPNSEPAYLTNVFEPSAHVWH